MEKGTQLIQQFEGMTQLAELKTLSKISIERPLDNSEYNRIMELKAEVLG